mgnify:CR=1 FL=1
MTQERDAQKAASQAAWPASQPERASTAEQQMAVLRQALQGLAEDMRGVIARADHEIVWRGAVQKWVDTLATLVRKCA